MRSAKERAQIIDLPEFCDDTRGTLAVAACGQQVPFVIRRAFAIYDMGVATKRGGHAHHQCQQFVLCVAGAVDVVTEDSDGIKSFQISRPTSALYVPQLTWLTITSIKVGTVIVVLSSDEFDEADYIWDRVEFSALLKTQGQ